MSTETETQTEVRELEEIQDQNSSKQVLAEESEAVLVQEPLSAEPIEPPTPTTDQLASDSQAILVQDLLAEESTETPVSNSTTEEMSSSSQAVLLQRPLPQLPPSKALPTSQEKITAFLRDPLTKANEFIKTYRPVLIVVGLILLAILSARLLVSLLNSIFTVVNSIPIFSSLVELIGIVYTIWFIYRYLLKADNRQELAQKVNEIKSELIGEEN